MHTDRDITAIVAATAEFVRREVIPSTTSTTVTSRRRAVRTLRTRLQARARDEGLLAPHGPVECGGLGLGMADRAPVFEAAGWSLFGPMALNINAPDEGNVHLLDHVAIGRATRALPGAARQRTGVGRRSP